MAVSKRKTYVSKGKYASVSKDTLKAMARDRSYADRLLAQLKHWGRGKRTMVTIPNPNKNETNKPFIRVEGNHPAAFGPWKRSDKDTGIRMSND
jgi:hypothetical protein